MENYFKLFGQCCKPTLVYKNESCWQPKTFFWDSNADYVSRRNFELHLLVVDCLIHVSLQNHFLTSLFTKGRPIVSSTRKVP